MAHQDSVLKTVMGEITMELGATEERDDFFNPSSSSSEDGSLQQVRVSPRKLQKVSYNESSKKKAPVSSSTHPAPAKAAPSTFPTTEATTKTAPPTSNNQAPSKARAKAKATIAPTIIRKSNKRGTGYSKDEAMFLLDCIEEIIPIGPQMWDRVSDLHQAEFSNQGRDTQSIRRKFNQMVNKRIPTGDPDCPEEVRRAKHLFREIEKKGDASADMEENEIGFPSYDDVVDEEVNESNDVDGAAKSSYDSPNPIRRVRTPSSKTQPSQSTDSVLQLMMTKMSDDAKAREQKDERRHQERLVAEERYNDERDRREKRDQEDKERRDRRDQDDKQRSDMMNMMMMSFMSKITGKDFDKDKNQDDK
jgi:hypothetical protein